MTSLEQTEVGRTKRIAVIRQATAADLPAIREMLTLRDEREWDQPCTNWFLCDLDPNRCLAWVAFAGDQPVGLTSMYVRALQVGARARRVGYWANLYIHPEFRDQMLYPRLPAAMNQSLKRLGLDFLYACVRQRDVAETHLRIGFGHVGRMNVLFKPLRPVRLIAKHKRLGGALEKLSAPVDFMFRAWLARNAANAQRDVTVEESGLDSPQLDQIVHLLNQNEHKVNSQHWTVQNFRDRFQQTREGGNYTILAARRNGTMIGAVIYRLAERGGSIRAGVIMHAAAESGQEQSMVPALIEAQRASYRDGAEVMLYLDGLGPTMHDIMRQTGYRVSPETYDMLIWPKSMLTTEPQLADLANWRFAFADHDAF